MIKRTFRYIYDIMAAIGEAKHARYKRDGYTMWY